MFGKYRFLVVSIALFLVFDLGVLVLNFYTSGKIAEQAELINLAGRQRTLTQQMSKATLYIKAQKLQLWVYQSGLDELRGHYTTFADTLRVFNEGGAIESTGDGQPIKIKAVVSPQGLQILERANLLWREFESALAPLMVDTLVTDEEIGPASAFIASNNAAMFTLMDDLTEYFKASAERQTVFLRRAQVVGISLATVNFFIILFHFLKQLRGRDLKIKIKQHESDQILNTIGEGVFLLDQNLAMSGQYSRQLEAIFSTRRVAGQRFERFLSQYFANKTVDLAMDFVSLYFRQHIDPTLIEDVNPLKKIEATITADDGETVQKYLDFSFAPLSQSQDDSTILVTVKDVTAQILLDAQDEQVADELEQKMSLLTQILPIPYQELDYFIQECTQGYERVNALLKDTRHITDNFEDTLNRIAREIHRLKGSAAALNLNWIAEQHHVFEDNIEALRERGNVKKLSGRHLLPLTIKLKSGYESLELVSQLRDRLGSYSSVSDVNENQRTPARFDQKKSGIDKTWCSLYNHANSLAHDQGLSLDVELRGFESPLESPLTAKLHPIAIQLLRNSIAHGIEDSDARRRLKKPNRGQLSITLSHDEGGNYRFTFQDDGRGFDYAAIRGELVTKNILTTEEAKQANKGDLVRHAFMDNVSTQLNTDQISGRGAGLPLVWQLVQSIDGRLKVRSVEREFTQFIIEFEHRDNEHEKSQRPLMERAS